MVEKSSDHEWKHVGEDVPDDMSVLLCYGDGDGRGFLVPSGFAYAYDYCPSCGLEIDSGLDADDSHTSAGDKP